MFTIHNATIATIQGTNNAREGRCKQHRSTRVYLSGRRRTHACMLAVIYYDLFEPMGAKTKVTHE